MDRDLGYRFIHSHLEDYENSHRHRNTNRFLQGDNEKNIDMLARELEVLTCVLQIVNVY